MRKVTNCKKCHVQIYFSGEMPPLYCPKCELIIQEKNPLKVQNQIYVENKPDVEFKKNEITPLIEEPEPKPESSKDKDTFIEDDSFLYKSKKNLKGTAKIKSKVSSKK